MLVFIPHELLLNGTVDKMVTYSVLLINVIIPPTHTQSRRALQETISQESVQVIVYRHTIRAYFKGFKTAGKLIGPNRQIWP